MNILNASNITKVFGNPKHGCTTKALDGISIKIDSGEFVGIMGPSGSGKTTCLKIIAGLDKATTGVVEIMEVDINRLNEDELAHFRRRKLGFVFQDFNLINSLTIKENIMLPMILEKRSLNEMEEKVLNVMSEFNINNIANKYPYEVSGGEQQRSSISRALVNEPAIILADEPTGNLDSKSSYTVMKCLLKINLEQKGTILMVTHDPFAASFCNRIVYIKDGKVHMELQKKEGQKAFLDEILQTLAVLGGQANDI